MLCLAAELLAQHGVLRGDPHRTRIEVADAHHHAAQHHQRCGREAELFRAKQRCDHHVPPRLQLPVHLDDDAVSELVQH